MRSPRTVIGIGLLWILLACLIFFGLASLNVPRLRAIARDPVSVDGIVARTDCGNHALVYFKYTVGDRTYTGQESRSDCPTTKEGDKVKIYYARYSPQLSVGRDPQDALWNELIPCGLAAVLVPPFIIFAAFLNRNRFRKIFPS
jgi:hypothetical protein